MNVPIGNEREIVTKDQSALEMVAYRDMWGKGTDSYLQMMYERLVLMREVLSESGTVFVHVGFVLLTAMIASVALLKVAFTSFQF